MQNTKVGNIIRTLRQACSMTQKQLADRMNISDKTVSKWERGLGCPDISLIPELSDILGVDTQKLLIGDITPNDFVGGNMKNTTYYVCPICHNISLCTGKAEISCCGKKLTAQVMKKAVLNEKLSVQVIEDDWNITSLHPMTKMHYISFVAFVTGGSIYLIKQYPEWDLNVRIHKRGHGMLIWYCTEHGLFYQLV
ncbi:MAG: helix-turn-helix domain-containing protein [Megasphaera sp.]|jgi:DNA-binding XRE family transcriptional regulator/desulfoferrodoxin (superoxide reductase-like protein)|uniref:helix-turn-helix domain-containing protein n=1 Tax=Megasphaera sueciensis TaxID=349094 RepID=UPI002ACB08A2|nr:helix-turn-helix domain-containing protein [Megasphaera sp.]MCI1823950.1 helix-turn-helix domain-containing protein [Megasphaera sp.]